MGRAIFAHTDRVVREDVDHRKPGKRGQTDRRTSVIAEDQKCRSTWPEDTVVAKAVEDAAHGMLAYAEEQVAPTSILCIEVPAVFYVVERRPMEVGAAGDDERHRLSSRLQHLATSLTRRNVGGRIELGNEAEQIGRFAGKYRLEFRRQISICLLPRLEAGFPLLIGSLQFFLVCRKVRPCLGRDIKLLIR